MTSVMVARDAQVSAPRDNGHGALNVADSGVGFDPRRALPSALGTRVGVRILLAQQVSKDLGRVD